MYVLAAILVFGLLIAFHELGHFLAAKACGIRVLEFSIGMGPLIFKRQGEETAYTLRLFPIGGFCSMEGEDSGSDDPRAFSNQSIWKRFITLVGGSGMNFVLGFLILLLIFGHGPFTPPVISGFIEGCPYEGEYGFLPGDEIYEIDGERIYFWDNIDLIMSRSRTGSFDIVLKRGGEKVFLDDFEMSKREFIIDGQSEMKYGLLRGTAVSYGGLRKAWYYSMDYIRLVRFGLADLFSGAFGIKDLSGPVGIVGLMNDVGRSAPTAADAFLSIANLTAFISLNLAVMNMLPIPALDGARIFFLFITSAAEHLLKRKINPKYEGYLHATGLVLLLALSAFVMYNDIIRLIRNAF